MLNLFTIYIDGEPYKAPEKTMTANQILSLGGISTDDHYLIQIKRNDKISFKGKGNEKIDLYEGAKFISNYTGGTPVSEDYLMNSGTNLIGAKLFAAQLRAVGYDVVELPDHHVNFPYTVDVGKHAGLTLEMGFVVPQDFPMTPPSGPHINKLLHPNQSGGNHPTGGIHPSPQHSRHFGSNWQYWSRPYPKWADGKRDAVGYTGFIRGLWASQ